MYSADLITAIRRLVQSYENEQLFFYGELTDHDGVIPGLIEACRSEGLGTTDPIPPTFKVKDYAAGE